MAEEFVAARVVTQLVTTGGDQVKQDLRENERMASDAKRRLQQLEAREKMSGMQVKPKSMGDAVAAAARATGASEAEIAKALGIRGVSGVSIPGRPTDTGLSKMMAALSGSSAKSRMIEGMSGAGFQQGQDVKEQRKAAAEAIIQAKEEAKGKRDLNKQTGDVTKGFGQLGKALGGEAQAILGMLGIGKFFGGVVGGAGAAAAAIGMRSSYLESAKAGVGLVAPGVAYRAERAELDLQAVQARHKIAGVEERSQEDRIRAAAFEQSQKQGGLIGRLYRAEEALGLRAAARWMENMTGTGPGPLERALAAKNPGGGTNAAMSALTGQFTGGIMGDWKQVASMFIRQATETKNDMGGNLGTGGVSHPGAESAVLKPGWKDDPVGFRQHKYDKTLAEQREWNAAHALNRAADNMERINQANIIPPLPLK